MPQPAKTAAATLRADYGLDAPTVIRNFLLLAITGWTLGALLQRFGPGHLPLWLINVRGTLIGVGTIFFLQALVMVWGSKVGKMLLRDKVLDSIQWRGNERVLDVGCGHGLMLIGAAKRIATALSENTSAQTSASTAQTQASSSTARDLSNAPASVGAHPGSIGHAIGIDIWQQEDQAGNSPRATQENVRREGVTQFIELKDADARALPFPDASFDVVLSSFAIHNIYDSAGREKAIREIARVLKPGGELAIADIRHTAEYSRTLRALGWRSVTRWFPNFLFVTPTRVLRATKQL